MSRTRWGWFLAITIYLLAVVAFHVGNPGAPPTSSAPSRQVVDLGSPDEALSASTLATRLASAPPELQTAFVRQLERCPPEERVPALSSFLRGATAIHPGALLESVLQLKRCGNIGSRALLELYPTLDGERRAVVLQAFEADRRPEDRALLQAFTTDPTDPLGARWAGLGTS